MTKFTNEELRIKVADALRKNRPQLTDGQRKTILDNISNDDLSWIPGRVALPALDWDYAISVTLKFHEERNPILYRQAFKNAEILAVKVAADEFKLGRPLLPAERISHARAVDDMSFADRVDFSAQLPVDVYDATLASSTKTAAAKPATPERDPNAPKLYRELSRNEQLLACAAMGERPLAKDTPPSEQNAMIARLLALDPPEDTGPDPRAAIAAKARAVKGFEHWSPSDRISAYRAGEPVPPNAGSATYNPIDKPVPRS